MRGDSPGVWLGKGEAETPNGQEGFKDIDFRDWPNREMHERGTELFERMLRQRCGIRGCHAQLLLRTVLRILYD